MKLTPRVGRNELCPCGSGRKIKVCCRGKAGASSTTRRSPALYLALGVAGVVLAVVVGQTFFAPASSNRSEIAPNNVSAPMYTPLPLPAAGGSGGRPSGPMSQPSGPAPEGKVWSPEHGHWHDLAATTGQDINPGVNSTPTPAGLASLTPQPPGPVPDGKVWSPEHGHWHDVTPTPTANPSPNSPDL
ncbi:MAG: SEC-C metal-binding domain-containing protein [Verrucomicrobia bacterium]|nr:SEC-C metal-binding domain-containing protein [Verrucomicrobiota bacterium]